MMKSTMSMIRRPITNLSQSKIFWTLTGNQVEKGLPEDISWTNKTWSLSLLLVESSGLDRDYISRQYSCTTRVGLALRCSIFLLKVSPCWILLIETLLKPRVPNLKSFVQLQVSLCVQNLLGSLLPLSFLLLVLRSLR